MPTNSCKQLKSPWKSKEILDRATLGENGCFIHNHNVYGNGRPQVYYKGKTLYASRVVCLEFHGSPPTDKHEAAHLCHNKLCVNPNHLRWATRLENIRMDGSPTAGPKPWDPGSEATESISEMWKNGTSIRGIARLYGVECRTIRSLLSKNLAQFSPQPRPNYKHGSDVALSVVEERNNGVSIHGIARSHSICRKTVRSIIARHAAGLESKDVIVVSNE